MADTIRVIPSANGADPAVATDDIAGIHYQKVKAGWGADGVWNETSDTDGVRLPVGGLQLGTLTEPAPASDTARAAGLNGRLQRIAQRLTSLIGQTAALAAATATDAGDESGTDEAIAAAAAGTRAVGFSARETTGAASALFNLRHGTSNAGALLVTVSLGPAESTREWYGPDGIAAASGIWLERVSGQTSVVGYSKVAS